MTWRILQGDCREVLRALPAESVQTCVTSPPYWGLRAYGTSAQVWGGDPACAHAWGDALPPKPGPGPNAGASSKLTNPERQRSLPRPDDAGCFCVKCGAWRGELGLEPTPQLYVEHVVEVFREVWRTLRHDGTLWLNLGDCYATGAGAVGECPGGGAQGARWAGTGGSRGTARPAMNGRGEPQVESGKKTRATRDGSHAGKHTAIAAMGPMTQPNRMPIPGLKPKDLVGIPWRVAFALQADGWWLRAENIWHKRNPMPESVRDRTTRAHEQVFLLTKSERYFYDADAIAESAVEAAAGNTARKYRGEHGGVGDDSDRGHQGFSVPWQGSTRNKRTVWTIATRPFKEAHFATFPPELPEVCILAGTSERGACAVCGAPLERVTEDTFRPQGDVSEERGRPLDESNGWDGFPRGTTTRKTIDWRPTCSCDRGASPVPCSVLDPFSGAGTTGLVARRLGRAFVGCELNPSYIALAERRIVDDAPLLNAAGRGA
jgi:DNA modification methylase